MPAIEALRFDLKLLRWLDIRASQWSPAVFRKAVNLTSDRTIPFEVVMQPWQAIDFAALDDAWTQLGNVFATGEPRHSGEPRGVSPWVTSRCRTNEVTGGLTPPRSPIRRAYIERPRGHSKTADMAIQIAWILQYAKRPLRGLAVAADKDQATLIHDAVARLAEFNRDLLPDLRFTADEIRNERNRAKLTVISSDVASSWGALPDFVICDELCHWEKPDLWHSLISSAAKQKHCVLTVLTNAGVGRDWHWEVRENARRSPRWHFSTINDPQAPWIDPADLEEQRAQLPPAVFDRLWRNIWQHSDGEFVTLEEAAACRDESLTEQSHGRPGTRYFAAIDYAEKHDYTAAALVHREGNRILVDRLDVWVPTPSEPVRIEWIEAWMTDIAAKFHDVSFVVDEYQLLSTIQRLSGSLFIERFPFAGGQGNHELAVLLRQLIVHRRVAWYAGCGAIDWRASRRQPDDHVHEQNATQVEQQRTKSSSLRHDARLDDLESELASLLLKQSAGGRIRFTHREDGRHHDDRAFTLAAACWFAMREDRGADWMQMTPPTRSGTFRL